MRSTDILMEEHELILEALRVLAMASRRIAEGRAAPAGLGRLLDFFTEFADGYHHAKEEGILFPHMVAAGLPEDGGPIGMMLHEHEQGRALVSLMREALPFIASDGEPHAVGGDVQHPSERQEARRRFVDAATWYRDHLSQHIQKENQILFRIAEQVLAPEAARLTDDAFERHAAAQPRNLPLHFHSVIEDLSASIAMS